MAKSNAVKADMYKVTKDATGYHFTITEMFKKDAVNAANDLKSMFSDKTPIAVNLWTAYKKVVVTDAVISRLQFFSTFDATIPVSYGKPGSAERKMLDTHKVYNGLTYLTFKLGKIAAGEGPAKRDPKVAKAEAKKAVNVFGTWVKKSKLDSTACKFLILNILKFKAKDGEMTKKGRDYMKAAGHAVAEDE